MPELTASVHTPFTFTTAANPGVVTLEIVGLARPQGDKSIVSANGRTWMIEGKSKAARDGHADWRKSVRDAAALHPPFGQIPVRVDVIFRFPRPASWPKKRSDWKNTKPDLDKLVRSLLDGLQQGGLIFDDGQVVMLNASKIVVRPDSGLRPGATVRVQAALS